ncbi:hypothetical protein, partial [Streptomyces sp. NPDC053048]|uniref:hypothetical protein n=1 Tax=Streptomyces sp. NPDC053048 TaxID=3365694 RepID=UPI0037CD494E
RHGVLSVAGTKVITRSVAMLKRLTECVGLYDGSEQQPEIVWCFRSQRERAVLGQHCPRDGWSRRVLVAGMPIEVLDSVEKAHAWAAGFGTCHCWSTKRFAAVGTEQVRELEVASCSWAGPISQATLRFAL